ncbi:M23 family metallopeptidase [Leptolyngbya sp. AN03gr2]|uniref:M23 family metallopeptidase n=1 Tax=unclassified Leptolyngbya TaxID=2650499 RepID=UPI003D318DC3
MLVVQWLSFESAALAQTTSNPGVGTSELPTVLSSVQGPNGSAANVLLPDWDSITFSTLPVIQEGGTVNLSQYKQDVGYDLSRTWQAGATPDQYLKLGDLAESLRPQDFTLGNIARITNINLDQVALSGFSLIAVQTIAEIAEKVPFLKDLPIREVAPIAALIVHKMGSVNQDQTLGQALEKTPQIGEYRLGDINLDPYSVMSIPNLDAVQMHEFSQWENAFLSEIPGLGTVPMTQFPAPMITPTGVVERIDSVYGPAETQRNRTISGSREAGFAVPCERNCGYIELDDLENTGVNSRSASEGHEWISGKYQLVPGGHGVLGNVNSGMEPTGRHPFGDAFKVVVWEPDETSDTVTTSIFFRYCHRFLGCTPYFIGPVPFFTYKRDSLIFVGVLEPESASSTASVPTNAERTPRNPAGSTRQVDPIPCTTASNTTPATPPGTLRGVNIRDLNEAIASRESSGDYAATGTYGCDRAGLCGRPLGRYQFMNYNEYAASVIAQRSGGQDFLNKVREGHNPSEAELMQFFPPADQERARQAWFQHLVTTASEQIDPQTNRPFQGMRLIERVAQMHNGGEYIPIDASPVQSYGTDIVRRYQASGGGSTPVSQTSTNLPSGCVSAPRTAPRPPQPPRRPTGNVQRSTPPRRPASSRRSTPPRRLAQKPSRGRATGRYIRPVDAPITSGFGYRMHPIHNEMRLHRGIDFGAAERTPIRAADGGRVVEVVNDCRVGDNTCGGGYGNHIVVDHGGGRQTLYGHLVTESIPYRVGSQVNQGDMIGRVGSTGWSTGPHLHFETLRNGEAVDPVSNYGL